MSADADEEALARRVLAALTEGDTEAFGELVSEQIEIHTARGVRRGRAAAIAWAASTYDHLHRRYAVERFLHFEDGGLLVEGFTQYVWKEGGEVADSSPVAIEMRFDDDGWLALWRFAEED